VGFSDFDAVIIVVELDDDEVAVAIIHITLNRSR
jgi:hypothetical protein